MAPGPISQFIDRHYRHFNAAAADGRGRRATTRHLDDGGQDAHDARGRDEHGGARRLARRDDPAGQGARASAAPARTSRRTSSTSSRTTHYERIPHYRDLTPADEQALLDRHLNRVTDTCIPEDEAMRRIETRRARASGRPPTSAGERYFPHEFMYEILRSGELAAVLPDRPEGQLAARGRRERNLPMFVPGWEDSTLGNMFAGARASPAT